MIGCILATTSQSCRSCRLFENLREPMPGGRWWTRLDWVGKSGVWQADLGRPAIRQRSRTVERLTQNIKLARDSWACAGKKESFIGGAEGGWRWQQRECAGWMLEVEVQLSTQVSVNLPGRV